MRLHIWLRWIHIYFSMASLLLVMFFSVSGVIINHPEWVPVNIERTSEASGSVPLKWLNSKDTKWLNIEEEIRAKHTIRGRAEDFQNDGLEASFAYRAAGIESDVTLDVNSGKYTIKTTNQGLLAVISDLHRGNNTSAAWKWVIDLVGAALTVISFTGFGILLYMKKYRTKAIWTLVVGTIVGLLATFFA